MPSRDVKPISLEEEYNKNTGITPEDIAKLRKWLKTQPHLPEKHITVTATNYYRDNIIANDVTETPLSPYASPCYFILHVLVQYMDLILAYHCCNCSAELSKQVLDLNLTLRTLFTAYFKDRKVDAQVEQTVKDVLMTPLPTRTREGSAILYSHFMNYDPKCFKFGPTLRTVLMIIDIWQIEEGTWPGIEIVVDLEGMSLGHLTQLDLLNMQRFLYYLQEAILLKLKAVHFLNAPSFMDKLLLLMKPFMKKALMDILYIHITGSKTIEKFVPIEALPKESGGKYKSYVELIDDVIERLRAYKEYFEKENEKRVTESLRPGKPKTISDIFGGVEGSFKKLEID